MGWTWVLRCGRLVLRTSFFMISLFSFMQILLFLLPLRLPVWKHFLFSILVVIRNMAQLLLHLICSLFWFPLGSAIQEEVYAPLHIYTYTHILAIISRLATAFSQMLARLHVWGRATPCMWNNRFFLVSEFIFLRLFVQNFHL